MTDPITQAAAEATCRTHIAPERIADHPDPRMAVAACFECQRRAEAVVAAVTPLIRAQIAAEIEAAKSQHPRSELELINAMRTGMNVAARIAKGDQQ